MAVMTCRRSTDYKLKAKQAVALATYNLASRLRWIKVCRNHVQGGRSCSVLSVQLQLQSKPLQVTIKTFVHCGVSISLF